MLLSNARSAKLEVCAGRREGSDFGPVAGEPALPEPSAPAAPETDEERDASTEDALRKGWGGGTGRSSSDGWAAPTVSHRSTCSAMNPLGRLAPPVQAALCFSIATLVWALTRLPSTASCSVA